MDPLTAKLLAQAAIKVATDEEARRRMLILILAPVIGLLLLVAFIVYRLTSPLSLLTGWLLPKEINIVDGFQKNYGYNQTICIYDNDYIVANGHRCEGNGSYHTLIPQSAKAYGLSVEGAGKSEGQKIVDALSSSKLVVAIMSKGHFTSGGHFIVLRGVTLEGKILVADPASYNRSGQEWDLSIILNEARDGAGAGGPFWIID